MRSSNEASVRGTHQRQRSARIASTGQRNDCKRPLQRADHNLLQGGGHPHMRRRDLLGLLGGVATCWGSAVRAQKTMPTIGCLSTASPGTVGPFWAAFSKGLGEAGYAEGQNVTTEYRWAEGRYDRLPALAADLVGRKVDVIVTGGGAAPAP